MNKNFTIRKNNKILFSTIFISALSLAGWGISTLIGSYIPLYLLIGFSVIFSSEKWLDYYTRKNKIIGKAYRLFLNLTIISLFVLLIWSGFLLFNHQFMHSPLAGSLVFIAEICMFIWLCRVVARNSWRQPSMKLTVASVVCLFLIFAFAGVQPMSVYKDKVVSAITTYLSDQRERASVNLEQGNSDQDNINLDQDDEQDVIDYSLTSVDAYADMFNQYRQTKGLTALKFTDDLNRVATLRLMELHTNFSHDSAGNYNEHLAENIAMSTGFLSNSDALELWQNSPGHNANMLNSGYRYTGYAIGNGYAVQLFTEYTTINGEPQLPPGWYWAD